MSKSQEALGRIRDLPDDELVQAEQRAREELFRLRLGNYTNQVENTISLRFKRRELARILTVARARSLDLEGQAATGSATGGTADAAAPARKTKTAAKKPAKAAAKKPAKAAAKTETKAASRTKSKKGKE